jgi:fluoroquinolone resistance protein
MNARPGDGPAFDDRTFAGDVAVAPRTRFERCVFDGAKLQAADLADCRFVECRFARSNLSLVRVPGAAFQDVAFVDCKVTGVDWTSAARFSGVSFERCVLDQCAFVGMDLRKLPLRGCRLREVVFAEADLSEADLRGADLQDAQFVRTKLGKADLRGARGYSIDARTNEVRGMKASLPDAAGLLLALGIDLEF